MNSHEAFIHIHQGCFAGTGAIVRLPQCQWSKPDGYGKISQCITTTKHSKAKTVCIFLGIYCKDNAIFMCKILVDSITITHWGRVTHICVSKLTIIGSDNGLSPGRHQAIIWTNAGILLIRTLRRDFSEILGEAHSFSFWKMHLKMPSAKWRLFGTGLNELNITWKLSALSALCGGNTPVTGEFPVQRAVLQNLCVFFLLAWKSCEQSSCRQFETPLCKGGWLNQEVGDTLEKYHDYIKVLRNSIYVWVIFIRICFLKTKKLYQNTTPLTIIVRNGKDRVYGKWYYKILYIVYNHNATCLVERAWIWRCHFRGPILL